MKPTEALRSCEGQNKVVRLFRNVLIDEKWGENVKNGYSVVVTNSKDEDYLPNKSDAHDKDKLALMRKEFKKADKEKSWSETFLEAQKEYIEQALKKCGLKEEEWVAGKNYP